MSETIQDVIDRGSINHRREREKAKGMLADFAAELNFDPKKKEAEADSIQFIVDVILPISWYTAKIKEAQRVRLLYIWGTGFLILFIPLLLSAPSYFNAAGTPAVIAQLTGLLTGVLALQKMMAGTLTQQQRYGAWRKVSSDLKKVWYGLQTRWGGRDLIRKWDESTDVPGILGNQFLADLKEAAKQGRQLIDDEEVDFFQKLTIPSVDLLDLLTKSRPDVSSMIGAMLPGASSATAIANAVTSQTTDLNKAKQDVTRYGALLIGLEKEIANTVARIGALPAGQPAPYLTDALTALRKRSAEAMGLKLEAEAIVAAGAHAR